MLRTETKLFIQTSKTNKGFRAGLPNLKAGGLEKERKIISYFGKENKRMTSSSICRFIPRSLIQTS